MALLQQYQRTMAGYFGLSLLQGCFLKRENPESMRFLADPYY